MDEIALIRALAPSADRPSPSAREAARRALDASIELSRAGTTGRRGLSSRRRILAFVGTAALAAVIAGVLVLNSGPTAQPAAAEVLHETAAVAESGEGPPALNPGVGQYLYTKEKSVELEGWYPNSYSVAESPASRDGGFTAAIPKEREIWMSSQGGSRMRQLIGTPRFLSPSAESRWHSEGAPLPGPFDPRSPLASPKFFGPIEGTRVVELGRGVVDIERQNPEGGGALLFPDLSGNPTDPEQLRLAVQNRRAPGISDEAGEPPLDTGATIERLAFVLHEPTASPALRAAAFNALAELPGVSLDRHATDLLGRAGYMISFARGGYGVRDSYIFDPQTSTALGERSVLIDTHEPQWNGYEPGLVIKDIAFLPSGVVDSPREIPR